MKAISLIQPWGTLILDGIKTIETRTWKTSHRGDVLICAGKKYDGTVNGDTQTIHNRVFKAKNYTPKFYNEHLQGVALCVVELLDVREYGIGEFDLYQGLIADKKNRFAWIISNVRPVKPVPIKGKLSLFEVDDSLIQLQCKDCNGGGLITGHCCNGNEEMCVATCPDLVSCSSCSGLGYVPYKTKGVKPEIITEKLPF